MAIDTRFSLLSLLARRRENFADWLARSSVASYEELCKKTDAMGAGPVTRAEYDTAAAELKARLAAVKKLARPAKSDENDGSEEVTQDVSSVLSDSRPARKARNFPGRGSTNT